MSVTVVATPTIQPTQTTSYTVSAGVVRSNPAQAVVDQSVLTVVPPAVCAINLPTLTVSPTSMSAQYPNPVTYAVTLTNNDSDACTTSTFSLSSNTLLNGVTTFEVSSAVTSPGLSIAPGGSATTTIVATPITLPAQSRAYIITAGASRAGQPGAAQGAVEFTVVPPSTNPPPTAVSTVQISVLGNRGSVAVSPLGLKCKDNCTITLNEAEWQTLTLQAVPSGQSCVQAIRGCEAGGGNSCTLTAGVSYEI